MTRVSFISDRATTTSDPSFRRLHNTYAYTDDGCTKCEFKGRCPARETLPLRSKASKE